jgi:hypothetical protein
MPSRSMTSVRNGSRSRDFVTFPFVEVKVDRKFVTGCANNRLKQSKYRLIVDLAHGYGARAVAEGVETGADFLTAREIGFDPVQGFLSAKPMSAERFAQPCWATSQMCLPPAPFPSIASLASPLICDPSAGQPAPLPIRSRAATPAMPSSPHATMRSKASRTSLSVSFKFASRLAKSGISAALASRSFSARGASSATNGLSRQSRNTWVSVW